VCRQQRALGHGFKGYKPIPAGWRVEVLDSGIKLLEENTGSTFGKSRKSATVVPASLDDTFEWLRDVKNLPSWDPHVESAKVVKTHETTDVVHIRYKESWPLWPFLPIRLSPRDMCLERCWETREDGSILIFFKSTEDAEHECAIKSGVVRAKCKSGAYTIQAAPNGANECLVTYALDVHPAGWCHLLPWLFVCYWIRTLLTSITWLRVALDHARFASDNDAQDHYDRSTADMPPLYARLRSAPLAYTRTADTVAHGVPTLSCNHVVERRLRAGTTEYYCCRECYE
jgi:hypothetical protein